MRITRAVVVAVPMLLITMKMKTSIVINTYNMAIAMIHMTMMSYFAIEVFRLSFSWCLVFLL